MLIETTKDECTYCLRIDLGSEREEEKFNISEVKITLTPEKYRELALALYTTSFMSDGAKLNARHHIAKLFQSKK